MCSTFRGAQRFLGRAFCLIQAQLAPGLSDCNSRALLCSGLEFLLGVSLWKTSRP